MIGDVDQPPALVAWRYRQTQLSLAGV